jgi:TonB family protein
MEVSEMFDKLIESDSSGAQVNGRKRYFVASSIVVGALFLTAVVISLYAADIDISGDFYSTRLIAPVLAEAPEPQTQPDPQPAAAASSASDELPSRTSHVAQIMETQRPPDGVSVVKNTGRERPSRDYVIRSSDFDPGSGSSGRLPSGSGIGSSSDTRGTESGVPRSSSENKPPEPPPLRLPEKQPEILRSGRVINGNATYLPKPPYPQAAIALNLEGKVDVQVTIDEKGNVISARSASGHPILQAVAVRAARSARFNPTFLGDRPVKVTGIIVYHFKRSD